MTRWIPIALLGLMLTGCQTFEPYAPDRRTERIEVIDRSTEAAPTTPSPRPDREKPADTSGRVPREVAFPAEEYARLDKSGTAVISGRFTLSGRPVSRRPVAVAPVTTYSAEAAEHALAGRAVEPADPRARDYTHTTRTDGNGAFRVTGLPGGDFYVSASGRDPVTGQVQVVIHQISLGKGQHREVDLSR